jgi:hypothetical protein
LWHCSFAHHDISHSNFITRKYYNNKEEVKMENERIYYQRD